MRAADRRHRLCFHAETNDLNSGMAQHLDLFDTINFEQGHHLIPCAKPPSTVEIRKRNGIGSTIGICWVTGQNTQFERITSKETIQNSGKRHQKVTYKTRVPPPNIGRPENPQSFSNVSVKESYTLQTVDISKTCLNPFDDKRYILEGGTTILAYGHCQLREWWKAVRLMQCRCAANISSKRWDQVTFWLPPVVRHVTALQHPDLSWCNNKNRLLQ